MKRMLALAICLMMLAPAALSEMYVINDYSDDTYGSMAYLLKDDGTLVADFGEYADIYAIVDSGKPGGPLYAVTKGRVFQTEANTDNYSEKTALMDAAGNLLTGFDYDSLYVDDGDCGGCIEYSIWNMSDNDWTVEDKGLLDYAGNVLVHGKYRDVTVAGEGQYVALDEDYAVLVIGGDGVAKPTGFTASGIYGPDRPGDPVRLTGVEQLNGRSIYINAAGEQLFDQSYYFCSSFENGYAVFTDEENGPCGAIDVSGQIVIPAECETIRTLTDGEHTTLVAEHTGEPGFTVYDGNTCQPLNRISFEQLQDIKSFNVDTTDTGLISVFARDSGDNIRVNNYYDMYGIPVLPGIKADQSLEIWYDVCEGTPVCYPVYENNEYQLMRLDGTACGDKWRHMESLLWKDGHGRYIVYKPGNQKEEADEYSWWSNHKVGVIDENGAVVLEPRYDSVTVLDLDRFWVREGPRSSMIDAAGNTYYSTSIYNYLID